MKISDLVETFDSIEYRNPNYFPVLVPPTLAARLREANIEVDLPEDKNWIYLSCKLTGEKDHSISDWQHELQRYCDAKQLVLVDPKGRYIDGWPTLVDYVLKPNSDPSLVVALDYFLILRSRMLVLDLTKGPSFGATAETVYARSIKRRAVMVTDLAHPVSLWARYYTDVEYSTRSFIEKLKSDCPLEELSRK